MNLSRDLPNLPPKPVSSKVFWKFALFLFVMFLFSEVNFTTSDEVYPAYLESIFEDGDLNIMNNYYSMTGITSCRENFRDKIVTSTFNHPDFHNHGSVTIWAPFYQYGNTITTIHNKLFPESAEPYRAGRFTNAALSFSTVALSFICCLLLYMVATTFSSPNKAFLGIISIFWGTPFFFYSLIGTGNPNILALLMSLLLILATPSALTGPRPRNSFHFGLLFAICLTIKLDLWFQVVFIGTSALFYRYHGRLINRNLIHAGAGFALGSIPKFINDYIKYGNFHSGEANLLNLQNSYHWQQLFSPYQGFFSTSPILLLCLVGLLVTALQFAADIDTNSQLDTKKQTSAFLLLPLTISLCAKLLIIGFRFAWGEGTFGARQLLTDLPIFTLSLVTLLQWATSPKRSWPNFLMTLTITTLILLNLMHAGEFISIEPKSYYVHPPDWSSRLAHLINLTDNLKDGLASLPTKLTCLPLLLILLWLSRMILNRGHIFQNLLAPWSGTMESVEPSAAIIAQRWLTGITLYLVMSYTVVTALNIANNRDNVKRMTMDGCFEFTRSAPDRCLEFEENNSSMLGMLEYFKETGDQREITRILAVQKKLYPDTSACISPPSRAN